MERGKPNMVRFLGGWVRMCPASRKGECCYSSVPFDSEAHFAGAAKGPDHVRTRFEPTIFCQCVRIDWIDMHSTECYSKSMRNLPPNMPDPLRQATRSLESAVIISIL